MARKNPIGEGYAPHRWQDRWRAAVTTGYDNYGEQEQKYVYGKTLKDCQEKFEALKRQVKRGTYSRTAEMTVKDWLEHWFKVKARQVKRRTIDEYHVSEKHVLSSLPKGGKIPIRKLTPMMVERMNLDLEDRVSARSALHAHILLGSAMETALRQGHVEHNVVRRVDRPRYNPKEYPIWTGEMVDTFLEVARVRTRYHALFYVALTMGLRPGELMALQWGDIDNNQIFVQRTYTRVGSRYVLDSPKTPKSRRLLHIPKDTQNVIGTHLGYLERTPNPTDLVFSTQTGQLFNHSNMSRCIKGCAKAAGVHPIRPHDLRHTYASMSIANGMRIIDLSRNLGHSTPSFTLDRYGHLFDRYDRKEAATLDTLLGRERYLVTDEEVLTWLEAPVFSASAHLAELSTRYPNSAHRGAFAETALRLLSRLVLHPMTETRRCHYFGKLLPDLDRLAFPGGA